MKKKFNIGNVVKTSDGSIEIITKTDDKGAYWIPISFSNMSGYRAWVTTEEEYTCNCILLTNSRCPDKYCDDCKGSGIDVTTRIGYDSATLLGSTVKDYIIKSLTQNFNF